MRKTHPAVIAGLSATFIIAAGTGVAVGVDTLLGGALPEAGATYTANTDIDPAHRFVVSTNWITSTSDPDTKTRYNVKTDDGGSYFTRTGTFTLQAVKHTGPFGLEVKVPELWAARDGKFTITNVSNTSSNNTIEAQLRNGGTTIKVVAGNGGLEYGEKIVVQFQLNTPVGWTPSYGIWEDTSTEGLANSAAEANAVASELDGYLTSDKTSLPALLQGYSNTNTLDADTWAGFREMVNIYRSSHPTSYGEGDSYSNYPKADLRFETPEYSEDYSQPALSVTGNTGTPRDIAPGEDSGWITFTAQVDGDATDWHSCKNVNIPAPTLALTSGGTVPNTLSLVIHSENQNGFTVQYGALHEGKSGQRENIPFGTGSVDLSSGDVISFKYKIVADASANLASDTGVYARIIANIGGQTGIAGSAAPAAIDLSKSGDADPTGKMTRYRNEGTVTIRSVSLTHQIAVSDQYPSIGDTIDCVVKIRPNYFLASGRLKVGLDHPQIATLSQQYGVKFLPPTSLPTGVSVPTSGMPSGYTGGINSAGNQIILNLTNIPSDKDTEIHIPIQVATSTATGIYNIFNASVTNSIAVNAVALPLNEANSISTAQYVNPSTQFYIQTSKISTKTTVKDLSLDIASGDTQKLVMNLGDRAQFRVVYSPTYTDSHAVTKNVTVSDTLTATAAGASTPLAANVAGIRIFSYTDPNTGENQDERDLIAKSNPRLLKVTPSNPDGIEVPADFAIVNNGTEDRITATPKTSVDIAPGESLVLVYSADLGSVLNAESQLKMRGATVTNAPELYANNIGGVTSGSASVEIASAQIKSFLTPSAKEVYTGDPIDYAMIIQCVPPEGVKTTGSAYAKGLHATIMLDEYAYQNGMDYGFDSIRLYRIVDGVARLLPDYTYDITPGGTDEETGENQFMVDLKSRYADSYRIKMVDNAYGSEETEPSLIAYDVRNGFVITFTAFTDQMKDVLGSLETTTDAAARADNAGYTTTQTDVTIKGREAGAPTVLPVSGPNDGGSTTSGGGSGSGSGSGSGTTGSGSGTGSGTGTGAAKGGGPLITTDASAPAVATGIIGGIVAWWAIRRQRNSMR